MFKSKSRECLTSKSNKKILLKYSNPLLFAKREKEKIKNIKPMKTPKKLPQKYNTIRNGLINNILNSFPSCQENDLIQFYNHKKKILRKNKTTLSLKTPLYITDNNFFSNHNSNNNDNKNNFITCEEAGSIKILRKIKSEIECVDKENLIEKIMDEKINLFQKKINSHKKYINLFFEQKNLELRLDVKKEQKLILEESNQNKLEYLEENIKGLEKIKKLFNFQFIIKLSNYVRYIKALCDKEKGKYILLLKEEMRHQKEIEKLNYSIKKIVSEKENTLKWIYLFIKVKEKKLILPKYYKNIIGTNYYDNILRSNMKINTTNTFDCPKQQSSKDLLNISRKPSIKKNTVIGGRSANKKSTEKFINLNVNMRNSDIKFLRKKIKNDLPSIFCLIDKEKVPKIDVERIIGYKLNLVFKTPEEFTESLESLNNHNLLLLKNYNQLEINLNISKKELVNIEQEKKVSVVIITNDQINEKQNELKYLKKKNETLKAYLNKLGSKKTLIRKHTSLKSLSYKSFADKKNLKVDFNLFKDKIFDKIRTVYESCKILNNKKFVDELNHNLKRIKNKESEIILLLQYIECEVDFLKESRRLYINEGINLQLLNDLIRKIDKKHKLEKPDKQKLEDIIKNQNLKKIVQNRNNKLLFLPLRKFDTYRGFKNRSKKKNLNKIYDDDFPKTDNFIAKMFYDEDEN